MASRTRTLEDQDRATEWIRASKIDVFSFYSTSERAVFFSIEDYQGIAEVYDRVGLALARVANPWPERYAAVTNVFQTFERLFNRGALDSTLLLKWRAKHRETTVTQIAQFYQLDDKGAGGTVRDNQYVGGSVPRVFKARE